MIDYKGYTGVFEYDPDNKYFAGHVEGITGAITFYGTSIAELEREMAISVDEYIAACKEFSVEPAKPYSGRFNVRMEPAEHRAVAEAAAAAGVSMNDWAVARLAEAATEKRSARVRVRPGAAETRKSAPARGRATKARR